MNKFKENLKVDVEPCKKKIDIDLILQYIKKEKEINREFDELEGEDVNAENYKPEATAIPNKIKMMMSYMRIRTRQAYLSKLYSGDRSREVMERLADIDKNRRDTHDGALHALLGLNEFARTYGLEPIYKGKTLTPEQIKSHDPLAYDIRKEMTDAIFDILSELDRLSFEICGQEKEEIIEIQTNMDKIDREYGVTKRLQDDDGDIEFKDFDDGLGKI